MSQPADDLDYRALGPGLWVDDWSNDHFLVDGEGDSRWGDDALELVRRRAWVLMEDHRKVDDTTGFPDSCRTLMDNTLAVLPSRWWLPKLNVARLHESAYAHTADPASFRALNTTAGIALHWELDERRNSLLDGDDKGDEPDSLVLDYLVQRSEGTDPWQTLAQVHVSSPPGPAAWLDTTATDGTTYRYRVLSQLWGSGGDGVAYSGEWTVTRAAVAPPDTAFYVYRVDEAVNAQPDNRWWPDTLIAQLGCYQPGVSEPLDLVCKIIPPRGSWKAPGGWLTVPLREDTTLSQGDDRVYVLRDTVSTRLERRSQMGMYACRFFRVSGQDTLPLLQGRWFTTASNNRIRSKPWYEYLADTDADAYRQAYARQCQDFLEMGGGKKGIMADSAEPALWPYHFGVPPLDYTDDAAYARKMLRFEQCVAESILVDHDFYANPVTHSPDSGLDLYQYLDGALQEDFVSHGRMSDYGGVEYWGDAYTDDNWSADMQLARQCLQSATSPRWLAWPDFEPANRQARWYTYVSFLLLADTDRRAQYAARHYDERVLVLPEMQLWPGTPQEEANLPEVPADFDWEKYLNQEKDDDGCPDTPYALVSRRFSGGWAVINVNHPSCDPSSLPFDPGSGTWYLMHADSRTLLDGGRVWSEPVSDTVLVPPRTGMLLLSDPVASPQVAEQAAEPLLRGQPSALQVRASHWNGQRLWMEVELDGLGLDGQKLVLTDDGQGQDAVADDSLYTGWDLITVPDSTPLGTVPLRYYARGSDGLAVYDTLWVTVADLLTTYKNRSAAADSNGLDYVGKPYASILLDYNQDGDEDLLMSRQHYAPLLFEKTGVNPIDHVPSFQGRPNAIPLQVATRGVSAADYDNDHLPDVFLAGETRSYILHNEHGTGFADSTSLYVQGLTDDAWAGVWADEDMDGWLDLYVCRADEDDKRPTAAATGHKDRLLINDGSGDFVDMADILFLAVTDSQPTFAACWGDVDNDGDQDLFVPSMQSDGGSPASHFYIHSNDDNHLVDDFTARFPGIVMGRVTSCQFTDLDGDGDLDLMTTSVSADGSDVERPRLFWNDGQGVFSEDPACLPGVSQFAASEARPLDVDLDGRLDLLLCPLDEQQTPRLYRNTGAPNGAGGVVFADVSSASGLDLVGAVDGALATDFDNDGDPDLFLGSPNADLRFYWSAVRADGAETLGQQWLGVKLKTYGSHATAGMGAQVWLEDMSGNRLTASRVMDGGSGRGGQQPPVLRFGLGSYQDSVVVKVRWSGGDGENVQSTTVNISVDTLTIEDSTTPECTDLVVTPHQNPDDTITWTVEWYTRHISDGARDNVTVLFPDGTQHIYVVGQHWTSHQCDASGRGKQYHRFTLSNQPCQLGTFRFTVYSSNELYTDSATTTRRVMTCITNPYPED